MAIHPAKSLLIIFLILNYTVEQVIDYKPRVHLQFNPTNLTRRLSPESIHFSSFPTVAISFEVPLFPAWNYLLIYLPAPTHIDLLSPLQPESFIQNANLTLYSWRTTFQDFLDETEQAVRLADPSISACLFTSPGPFNLSLCLKHHAPAATQTQLFLLLLFVQSLPIPFSVTCPSRFSSSITSKRKLF